VAVSTVVETVAAMAPTGVAVTVTLLKWPAMLPQVVLVCRTTLIDGTMGATPHVLTRAVA
jgi:hypothetical protein